MRENSSFSFFFFFEAGCQGSRRTFFMNGVLIENIDELIFTTGLPISGVVCSIVLQEGKVNPFLILHRQGEDMLQEFISHSEVMRAHPVGAELHFAVHPNELLVLCDGEQENHKFRF